MAIAMVIIAQYHMEVNLFGETICKSEEEPVLNISRSGKHESAERKTSIRGKENANPR